MLVLEPAHKQLILIDIADGSCPVVLDTVFSGPLRPAWRKAVIRSNFSFAVASNDGRFHLSLNGKGVFCIEGWCAKEELVEISAQWRVKMTETIPSAWLLRKNAPAPWLAPWPLERGLVNVYRRTGSILMMPTAKMPNVWRPIWKIRKKTITAKPSALGADGFCSIRILSIGIHTLFMDYFYCQKSFGKSNVICPAFLQELSIVKFSQKNPAAWLRDFRICTE